VLKVEKGAICRLISETRRRINELGAGKVAAIILACQKTTGIAEAIKQSNTNSQKQIKQMKKQISKIQLKSEKILVLSGPTLLQMQGGQMSNSGFACVTTFAGTCYRTAKC
jgi:predicted RND superfamily exporter protein